MDKTHFKLCRVNACDPEKQVFYLMTIEEDAMFVPSDERGFEATLITGEPYDGNYAGRFENIKRNTIVMAMFIERGNLMHYVYVLGYTPLLNTSGTYGQTFKPNELEPGERRDVGITGLTFERKRNGTFRYFYNQFCQFSINRILQKISGKLNSIAISMRTGKFKWEWNRVGDLTKFRTLVTRGYLHPGDYSASVDRPLTEDDTVKSSDTFHDRVDLKMMDECAEGNLLELRTQQPETATDKKGNYYTETIVSKTIKNTVLNKNNGNKIVTNIMGDNALDLDVNEGKVKLTVTHDGNITLSVDDTILLGGSGSEQELLTKSYHDNWAANHMHSNGNMGSPTGPPMLPIMPAVLPKRGKTNWYTKVTKAE